MPAIMIVSTIATIIVVTLVRLTTGRRGAAVASALVVVAALVALRRLLLLTLQRTIRHLLVVNGLEVSSLSSTLPLDMYWERSLR